MIIVHSTGEEAIVLYTSTIIFSYLVNYIDGIRFVINEIIGTMIRLYMSYMSLTIDKFSIKMPRGYALTPRGYGLTLRSVSTPPDDSTILDLSSDTWYLTKHIYSPYRVAS